MSANALLSVNSRMLISMSSNRNFNADRSCFLILVKALSITLKMFWYLFLALFRICILNVFFAVICFYLNNILRCFSPIFI